MDPDAAIVGHIAATGRGRRLDRGLDPGRLPGVNCQAETQNQQHSGNQSASAISSPLKATYP